MKRLNFLNQLFDMALTEDEILFTVEDRKTIIERELIRIFKETYNIPQNQMIINSKLYKKYYNGWELRRKFRRESP